MVYQFETAKLPFSLRDEADKLTLADTYIPPTFNEEAQDLQNHIDEWLIEDSLKQIALLGDYGLGKTSFLKFYAHYLAKSILTGKKVKRFPVLISLTSTSPMHRGINNAIKSFIVDNRLEATVEAFYQLVYRGKIVFLLDGFDEMGFIGSHEQRFEQLNAIWQLATKGNKMVISGRPSYFPTKFEEKQGLRIRTKEEQIVPQEQAFCERLKLIFFTDKQISNQS